MNVPFKRNPFRLSNLRVLWVSLSIVALTLAAWATLSSTTFSADNPQELLPNLKPLPAKDFRLEELSDGTIRLRFSMTSWNSGLGDLELFAGATNAGFQQIHQRIFYDDGSFKEYPAGSFSWHPTHNHFHVDNYANYSLTEADSPGVSKGTGSKTTFCIIDTDRIDHKLPGASKKRQYTACNGQLQGMSVGWGDTYTYNLDGQWIMVTNLAKGDYKLSIDVDPNHNIMEMDDFDNSSYVLLHIDVDAGIVQRSDEGNGGGRRRGRCPQC